MNKKILFYICCIVLFLSLWFSKKGALLLYNVSPSVAQGWYIRQFLYKDISCSPVYAAIDPIWIAEKFPEASRELQTKNILLIKYIENSSSQYIKRMGSLPQSLVVHATSSRGISSRILGPVASEHVRGLYCYLRSFAPGQ